jgi:hypothetical protein
VLEHEESKEGAVLKMMPKSDELEHNRWLKACLFLFQGEKRRRGKRSSVVFGVCLFRRNIPRPKVHDISSKKTTEKGESSDGE